MKKYLLLLLAAALLCSACFTLSACGEDPVFPPTITTGEEPDDTTEPVTEPPETDPPDTQKPDEGPVIASARRINDKDIEIYYTESFRTGRDPSASSFTVTLDGRRLPLDSNYGTNGKLYFYEMTTLHLQSSLPTGDDAPELTVTFKGVDYPVPYENYYKYEYITECGITVRGSNKLLLGMETLKRAGEMVDIMLAASPEVAAQMVKSRSQLVIYGKGECAFHIPEHRSGYNVDSLYVEGFGGITCSITESNVWHWHKNNNDRPDKSYYTSYLNENIMVHEFGHGVKIAGFDLMSDKSLSEEFQMLYRHSKAAGLWPNSYAISNSDEFFATLSAIWFNVMNESNGNDYWDGVRGPINTRDELYNYDIDAYRFFAKLYPFTDLDGAWTAVPDYYTITGLSKDPAPDLTGKNYTLNYPGSGSDFAGLEFGKVYKLCWADNEYYTMDTAASNGYTGLWFDYSANTDAAGAGAMTYTFEQAPGSSAETVTNSETGARETVYTVYIKGVRDGYLNVEGGNKVRAGASKNTQFKIYVNDRGFFRIEYDGKTVTLAGNADIGTALTLEEGADGTWRLADMSNKDKKVLFIHDAKANGSDQGVLASAGETVTLKAPIISDGGRFVGWRVSAGEVADPTARDTTFVMPASDVVVWALYE